MNRYVDLVSTMEHPETYEPQPPALFRQVDGLYDWLKDGQFRYVSMGWGSFNTFSCNGMVGHGNEPWQPMPLERWLKSPFSMHLSVSKVG